MGTKIDKINNILPVENKGKKCVNLDGTIAFAYFLIARSYFASAEKLLLVNLALFPNEARLFAALGSLYADSNQDEKAINAFNRAIDLDPFNPDGLYYFGYYYSNETMLLTAAEKYAGLLQTSTDINEKARLASQLGQCLMILGKMPEALDAFILAFRLNPNCDGLMVCLATFIFTVRALVMDLDLASVHDDVIAMLNKTAKFIAEVLKVPPLKITRETNANELAGIFKEYGVQMNEMEISCNPRCCLAYLNLGIFYLGEKEYEKAEKSLRKAIEIYPQNPISHFNLGLVLLFKSKIGQCKQAEIEFDRAKQLKFKDGGQYFFIAQMYLETNNFPLAEKWFKAAFDVYCQAKNEELFFEEYNDMLKQMKDDEKIEHAKDILDKIKGESNGR